MFLYYYVGSIALVLPTLFYCSMLLTLFLHCVFSLHSLHWIP